MKNVNALAKLMAKDTEKLAACHNKAYIRRARILKHALMVNEKLKLAIARLMPLADVSKVDKMGSDTVDWMVGRRNQRYGRKVQVKA